MASVRSHVRSSLMGLGAARVAAEAPGLPPASIGVVAVTREVEPWSDLLEAAAEDARLVAESYTPARRAEAVPIPDDLQPSLRAGLGRAGIESLYSHQAEALTAAERRPVIVTTGTAL